MPGKKAKPRNKKNIVKAALDKVRTRLKGKATLGDFAAKKLIQRRKRLEEELKNIP